MSENDKKENLINQENISKNNKKVTKSKKILGLIIVVAFVSIIVFGLMRNVDVEEIRKSVVMIKVYNEEDEQIAIGSGFCVFDEDIIATNFHVIEGAYKINIVTEEQKEIAVDEILIFDNWNDLALLRGDFNLTQLKLANTETIKAGDEVTAIGSPLGEMNTVSTGIVSNNLETSNIIQITAPISSGSSGGVLLNKNGKVIGVTYATLKDGQNLNYAIKIEKLKELCKKYNDKDYTTIKLVDYMLNEDNAFITDLLKNDSVCQLELNAREGIVFKTEGIWEFGFMTDKVSIYSNVVNIEYSTIDDELDIQYMLTEEELELGANIFEELLKYEPKAQELVADSQVVESILDWSEYQYLLELDVVSRLDLSVLLAVSKKYTTKEEYFNFVDNNMPLDSAQKVIVLLLLGRYKPSDFVNEDAEAAISFINDTDYTIEEKTILLRKLGYTVVGTDIYW